MTGTDRGSRFFSAVVALGCVVFAMPLIAHAYAGTAGRYLGDDYCAGYIFRDYGFIGGQIWHYQSWSAVPTTLLLMAITDPGGSRLAPILPAAALVLWLLAATWAARSISALRGPAWGWLACLWLAEVLLYATIQDAPNVTQSLYLRVPMLAYTCPLIVLTVYVGWLAGAARSSTAGSAALIASAIFACVFGAFGAVCATFLTAALALALVPAWLMIEDPRRRRVIRLVLAGLGGALVALTLVALAPGNATRQVRFPSPPGLLKVGVWSVAYSIFMFARPVVPFLGGAITTVAGSVLGGTPRWLPTALDMGTSPVPMLIAIAVPVGLARLSHPLTAGGPHLRRALWWIPPAVFVLVCACMAPGAYGTSAPPPPRALIVPQYVMTCLAACWGFALGATIRAPGLARRQPWMTVTWLIVACLLMIGPVSATFGIVARGTTLRKWAQRWDETDRQLRLAGAAGVLDVTVPALEKVAGVGSISPDPTDWVNICAAHYYGLRSITGRAGSR